MPKSKGPKTHFEQVPLEIVKKIAQEDIPDDEANDTRRGGRSSGKKVSGVFGYRASHDERTGTSICMG